jgi:cardiolipin synthase
MMDAADRGVKVIVIMPKHSDVRLVDVLRNKYLGLLFEKNIHILFYSTGNLHAKCMLIDNDIFSIGSPNFDYRSFRYQYEISLIGSDDKIVGDVRRHMNKTLSECEPFDYEKWKTRPKIERLFEWILLPLRHLL